MRSGSDDHGSGGSAPSNELPTNIEAEEALLGALLLKNALVPQVSGFLKPDHFADEAYKAVYAAILAATAEGRLADPITLRGSLPAAFGEDSAAAVLAHLAASAVGFRVTDYARAIVDGSLRRSLALIGDDIALCARQVTSVPIGAQLDDTEKRLTEVRALHGIGGDVIGSAEAWDRHEQARFGGVSAVPGYAWPFPQLSAALDGDAEPGNLYGLVGASGDAKTSLTLQLAFHFASLGLPSLFLSGEQSDAQCRDQIYSQQLGIPAKAIKRASVSDDEFARIRALKGTLRDLPLRIEEWPEEPVSGISRRVRAFCSRYQRGCFFAVDHASQIAFDNPKEMWAEQVRRTYLGLKRICAETGSIGLVLMHRSSDFLGRRRMRPVIGDIYGKEVARRALDGCFALYRPGMWLREAASIAENDTLRKKFEDEAILFQEPGAPTEIAEIYSLKTRFGAPGQHQTRTNGSHLLFEGRFTRFLRPNKPAQVDMLDEPERF